MKAVLKVRYKAQQDHIDNGPASRPKRKSREPSRYRTKQDYVDKGPASRLKRASCDPSSKSNAKARRRAPAKPSALECSSAPQSTETSKLPVHPTLSLCTARSARYDSSPQKCATVFNVEDGRTIFAISGSNTPKHEIMHCSDVDIECNERSYSATLRPHRPDRADVLGSGDEWGDYDADEESIFGTSPLKEVAGPCNVILESQYDDPKEEATESHLNNHNEIFHNSSVMHHESLLAALAFLQSNKKILAD